MTLWMSIPTEGDAVAPPLALAAFHAVEIVPRAGDRRGLSSSDVDCPSHAAELGVETGPGVARDREPEIMTTEAGILDAHLDTGEATVRDRPDLVRIPPRQRSVADLPTAILTCRIAMEGRRRRPTISYL